MAHPGKNEYLGWIQTASTHKTAVWAFHWSFYSDVENISPVVTNGLDIDSSEAKKKMKN